MTPRSRRRGSQAVEFALLLPLLVLLGGGIVDTANYLAAQQALAAAVQDGARNGAAHDWRDAESTDAASDAAVAAAAAAWEAGGRFEEGRFEASVTTVQSASVVKVTGVVPVVSYFPVSGFPDELRFARTMRLDWQPSP